MANKLLSSVDGFIKLGSNVGDFLSSPTGANLASALTTPLPVTDGGTGSITAALALAALGGMSNKIAIVADQKSNNTQGGTCVALTWNDRVLNTKVTDINNIVSLASNTITLQAGTYLIAWTCPLGYTARYSTRLKNVTDTTYNYGACGYTANDSLNSVGFALITIASAKDFKIQTYTQNGVATEGLGSASNGGGTEVYTQVVIIKRDY